MLIVLAGYAAFILASFVLGIRLLRLWTRTRQLPELATGTAFLLGGAVGYVCWLVLSVLDANPDTSLTLRKGIILLGLACSCIGGVTYGLGTAQIFRAGQRWPYALIGLLGAGMLAAWTAVAVMPYDDGSFNFWYALLCCGGLYLWGAIESFTLAQKLDRRARLGMAEPMIVNRTVQWGIAAAMISCMIGVSFTGRLVYGLPGPEWLRTLTACMGVLAAVAIYLGFFPTQALRDRISRAYAS